MWQIKQHPTKYLILEDRTIILDNVKQIINRNDEGILIEFMDGQVTSIDGNYFDSIKKEMLKNNYD